MGGEEGEWWRGRRIRWWWPMMSVMRVVAEGCPCRHAQSVRTGGGEGGFVAARCLVMGMVEGDECEEWELWEELRVTDEEGGVEEDVGTEVWAGTGPGQDASQVVESKAEQEVGGTVVPMQMVQTGGGEGEFVAMEAGRGPGQDVSQGMELGQSRREG